MRQVGRNDACPCGSGQKFKKCCEPALSGAAYPATPEAVMRSRYAAFVTGNTNHLWRTSHPENEMVNGIDPEEFRRETLAYCQQVEFTGLTVHEALPPDEQGVAQVAFTAAYRMGDKEGKLKERSDFVQLDDRWVYRGGKEEL
jgi:SEC-C motif-containing protein